MSRPTYSFVCKTKERSRLLKEIIERDEERVEKGEPSLWREDTPECVENVALLVGVLGAFTLDEVAFFLGKGTTTVGLDQRRALTKLRRMHRDEVCEMREAFNEMTGSQSAWEQMTDF